MTRLGVEPMPCRSHSQPLRSCLFSQIAKITVNYDTFKKIQKLSAAFAKFNLYLTIFTFFLVRFLHVKTFSLVFFYNSAYFISRKCSSTYDKFFEDFPN